MRFGCPPESVLSRRGGRALLLGAFLLGAGPASGAGLRGDSVLPRNVVHADVLAGAFGKEIWGGAYEWVKDPKGNFSYLFEGGALLNQSVSTAGGADVPEVEADLGVIGFQFRYYGHPPRGFFSVAGLALLFGEATGEDDDDREHRYTAAAFDVTVLGFGYQFLILNHLSVDGSVSYHTSLGGLFEKKGDDRGTIGGFGFGAAGGIGFAF